MSCAAIMSRELVTVGTDDSVGAAAQKLIESQFVSLPVVDGEGRYAGMFGIHDLLSLVVPRVALAGNLLPNLRFIGDDAGELKERFREMKSRRVGDVADRSAATLRPDTPETEAVRLFCQNHNSLAVVESGSGKVLGIVSCWDVIRAIAGTSI